jgi:hypothetical protein
MYMGKVALTLFPETGTLHPLAGPLLYCLGFITALIFFGFAIMWLIFALAAISKAHPFPFNMGWYVDSPSLSFFFFFNLIQVGVYVPSRRPRLQRHSNWCRIAKCSVQRDRNCARSGCHHTVVRCCCWDGEGCVGWEAVPCTMSCELEKKRG